MSFPEPVLAVSIEPKTKADQEKLGVALGKLMQEDPTFRVHTDPDTARRSSRAWASCTWRSSPTDSSGSLELALLWSPDGCLQGDDHGGSRRRGSLRSAERWSRQFGHCKIKVRPAPEGSEDFVFNDKITGGVIPREFIQPTANGIREALESGPLAGYPVTGVEVDLIDGSFHEVDSSEVAFKIAGSMAWRDAAGRAQLQLLEPVMAVEVVTPEEYMGEVMGDLNARRVVSREWTPAAMPR